MTYIKQICLASKNYTKGIVLMTNLEALGYSAIKTCIIKKSVVALYGNPTERVENP
jgi:hypothetical protein